MREERRLVWRVLRHWRGIANRGRVPRRDDIEPWLLGEDGRNCLLVAVQSPIELSHFLLVGVNLAVALCATDTLAGVLLSHVPRVVSTRRALMIEGSAMLRKEGILYRGILLPLSEDGVVIDQVLGATNYRSLREDEAPNSSLKPNSLLTIGLESRAKYNGLRPNSLRNGTGNLFRPSRELNRAIREFIRRIRDSYVGRDFIAT